MVDMHQTLYGELSLEDHTQEGRIIVRTQCDNPTKAWVHKLHGVLNQLRGENIPYVIGHGFIDFDTQEDAAMFRLLPYLE